MRIAGGACRGKRLETPKGRDIRPTSDKVRQAIFNMIGSRGGVDGAHVIDAFCGSGALGLEALSRGAESCLFIDKNAQSLSLAKTNVATCELTDKAHFLKKDSTTLGERIDSQPCADLVFLDPPYQKDMVVTTIEALNGGGWIADDCLWVIECDVRETIMLPPLFEILSEKKYGDTAVILAQITSE